MAHISTCQICNINTLNSLICADCKDEIVNRTLAGESVDPENIRTASLKARNAKWREESEKMLESQAEEWGRSDWRKYRNQRDSAFHIIDSAIKMIEAHEKNILEIQSLKKLLESIDTGRESKKKTKNIKSMLRTAFLKEGSDGNS